MSNIIIASRPIQPFIVQLNAYDNRDITLIYVEFMSRYKYLVVSVSGMTEHGSRVFFPSGRLCPVQLKNLIC